MATRRCSGAHGALEARARDASLLDPAIELVEALAARGESACGPLDFAGEPGWLKAGPLRGRAAWRWALRGALLRHGPPRASELENLRWLRERLFLAPEPLAAAWIRRGGAPRFQMLVTRRVEGARTLEEHLRDGDAARARRLLLALADVVSRLHALHFVHRDLYPRNVLVRRGETGDELWLVDAWRGGERLQTRGAAYDVACLLLRAPETIGAELQRELLDAYALGRERQGKPLRSRARFASAVRDARRALAKRLLSRPAEWRGYGAPRLDWDVV